MMRLKRLLYEPALWLTLALLSVAASGLLYASGHRYWGIACICVALTCSHRVLKDINRLRRRLRYLVNAALNDDFTYKFPTANVPEHERDINITLNRLVTHLEQMSENARQNEAFLSVVINLVDIGIIVANSKGHVVQANKAALSLLSLPAITDVRQIPGCSEGLAISRTPSLLHGEAITIFTVNDYRKPLQAAEVESWEKLTRVLTHEIMNSLTPIHSIAESLNNSATPDIDPDKLHSRLAVISSSSEALMEFVKKFRMLSLLAEPDPTVFYLKPFIENAVSLVASADAAAEIEFKPRIFPPDAMTYTDKAMLNQVVINILKNAIEAHPTKIEVNVTIRSDESVQISVTNDGEHIPAEHADQIFTPFFTTKREGSGIGLSLSRRIVTRLGGSLTLRTQPHTTFTITLP